MTHWGTREEQGNRRRGDVAFLVQSRSFSIPLLSIHFVPHWPLGDWELLVIGAIHLSVSVLWDPVGSMLWSGNPQPKDIGDELSCCLSCLTVSAQVQWTLNVSHYCFLIVWLWFLIHLWLACLKCRAHIVLLQRLQKIYPQRCLLCTMRGHKHAGMNNTSVKVSENQQLGHVSLKNTYRTLMFDTNS